MYTASAASMAAIVAYLLDGLRERLGGDLLRADHPHVLAKAAHLRQRAVEGLVPRGGAYDGWTASTDARGEGTGTTMVDERRTL